MALLQLIFIVNAFAKNNIELKVEHPINSFELSMQSQKFTYHSRSKKIEKTITECSKPAYDRFFQKIESKIDGDFSKLKNFVPNMMKVTIDKEQLFFPVISDAAVYLFKLDTEIEYLIGETIYRCSKK